MARALRSARRLCEERASKRGAATFAASAASGKVAWTSSDYAGEITEAACVGGGASGALG